MRAYLPALLLLALAVGLGGMSLDAGAAHQVAGITLLAWR